MSVKRIQEINVNEDIYDAMLDDTRILNLDTGTLFDEISGIPNKIGALQVQELRNINLDLQELVFNIRNFVTYYRPRA